MNYDRAYLFRQQTLARCYTRALERGLPALPVPPAACKIGHDRSRPGTTSLASALRRRLLAAEVVYVYPTKAQKAFATSESLGAREGWQYKEFI